MLTIIIPLCLLLLCSETVHLRLSRCVIRWWLPLQAKSNLWRHSAGCNTLQPRTLHSFCNPASFGRHIWSKTPSVLAKKLSLAFRSDIIRAHQSLSQYLECTVLSKENIYIETQFWVFVKYSHGILPYTN